MDKTLAARRLSAALGMKVEPSTIESVADDGVLRLKSGIVLQLCAGNTVRRGPTLDEKGGWVDGFWVKNGKLWNPRPDEEAQVRDLPETKRQASSCRSLERCKTPVRASTTKSLR